MAKILVTGGCGFIGSHTIIDLLENGYEIVNVDNLSNSSISVVDHIREISGKEITHYTADLCNLEQLKDIFKTHSDISGVIHFAALKSVSDSVSNPLKYFQNNVNGHLNLLKCVETNGIKHFVFSSSCTVYGNAETLPVTEESQIQKAESPYGRTKQIGEYILEDLAKGSNMSCISLRYFNPAGAHPSGLIGEAPTNPAQNLVPIITEVAIGKRAGMTVFGDDYDTPDGSCIRDYIHIMDLASAHTAAMYYLINGHQQNSYDVYNVGIGKGVSVLEAIAAFEKNTKQTLNYTIGPRRSGDVVAIFADNSKITKNLGWNPSYNLDDIMASAWKWEQKRTNG